MAPLVDILVAHELRAYREAIAAAVQACRPTARVMTVAPTELAAALTAAAPQLVVASQPPSIPLPSLTWVELYPGGRNVAVLHRDDRQTTVSTIDFDTLLALIDAVLAAPQPTALLRIEVRNEPAAGDGG